MNGLSINFDVNQLLPASILDKIGSNLDDMAGSFGGGLNFITYGGREFHLKMGGAETSHPSRTLDFVLVAGAKNDHRVFYRGTYEAGKDVLPTCWSSDDVTPDANVPPQQRGSDKCETCPFNAKDSHQSGKGRACTRKRRAVVMLPDDTEQRLFLTDVSALSIYGERNTQAGYLNWQQVTKQLATYRSQDKRLVPFVFVLQMSFTQDTVPVTQFSFVDQVTRSNIRMAPQQIIEAAGKAWESGEVERLLSLEIGKADAPAQEQAAPAQPTQQAAPAQPSWAQQAAAQQAQPVWTPQGTPAQQAHPSTTVEDDDDMPAL